MRYIIKALRTLMCGATSSGQIEQFARLRVKWLKKFLRLEHGVPHRLTIERTLTLLDPRQFQAVFNEIMQLVGLYVLTSLCEDHSFFCRGFQDSPFFERRAFDKKTTIFRRAK